MNKLIEQLQRLYFLPDQRQSPTSGAGGELTPAILAQCLQGESTVTLDLVNPQGRVRAIVLGFARMADWERVAALYQGLQEDFDLPLPALSISSLAGYQLWLSLAECVPLAEARLFIEAIRSKYLADLPPAGLSFHPAIGEPGAGRANRLDLVPAWDAAGGKWSAFIDPSMGAMFADAPGLDMAPNMDRQADLLAGLESIKTVDFQRVLDELQSAGHDNARLQAAAAFTEPAGPGRMRSTLNVGHNFTDPKTFLLAVMNDPSASAGQRIKAARALLPYFRPAQTQ